MSDVNGIASAHERTTSDVSLPLHFAWFVAFAATLGALFIGEVLGQNP